MKRVFSFLTVIVAAAGATACGGSPERHEAVDLTPVRVSTAQAIVTTTAERLEAGGVVTASESASLSSRIVAPVLTVRVRAGDRVRAGEVLITLDARDVAAQARQATASADAAERNLAQTRSARAAAEAEHRLAAAWNARITSLYSKNSATAHERDEATARLATADARLAGAAAAIDAAESTVAAARAGAGVAAITESFTVIRAPFDGLVTARLIDPGNLAAPGTPLLQVESGGGRRVEATVDEARAVFIKAGDRVAIAIESSEGEAIEPPGMEGTVIEVARAIAVDRRAFTVKVSLPPSIISRTGTFARVRFRGASRRALLIPASAVRRQGQIASVFVVADGKARLRLIQTGNEGPEGVAVLAGLDAGELVITSPPPQLGDTHPVIATPSQSGARQ